MAVESTGGRIEIEKVTDRAGLKRFIDLPFDIFRDDPNWIPPLKIERHDHFNPKSNPYFDHAEVALWLARRDGQDVGRISAQVCELKLRTHGDEAGKFGFIDAVDDPAVFASLFAAAEDWLRGKGLKRVQGPFNFSVNDEIGLLVDGFDTPPFIMMGHALPYYRHHVEAAGYRKAKDLYAYFYDHEHPMPERMKALLEKAKSSGDIDIRPLNKKKLAAELEIIRDIFNDAWSENWGFVPWTDREVEAIGKNLRFLVKERYVAIASYRGEPVAMAVTLPNINEEIADLNGRLFPFNWAKLVWRLTARPPNSARLPLMGVRKKYQTGRIGALLALGVIETIREYHTSRGTHRGELSWILEDNMAMRHMIESVGARIYKTYRMYEKAL